MTDNGGSPLHMRVCVDKEDNDDRPQQLWQLERMQCALLLLIAGADANTGDISGESPLDYTRQKDDELLLHLLESWSRDLPPEPTAMPHNGSRVADETPMEIMPPVQNFQA